LKNSHLLTVAGLLELLLMEHNKPRYDQGRIATAIEEKGWRGASASTVTKLFAEAKVAANEAEKITQAKAEARDNAAKLRPKR
jgi:anti-sigma regulatory factor (Ser/Thr protein kinase)